jgi:hypothetical protein
VKLYFEGQFQLWNDQSYLIGIGVNSKYNFHISGYYEKYSKPSELKINYGLTSRVAYEFKFVSLGLYVRHLNIFQEGKYRLDIAPEMGIGYKYLWITYSRNLLLYQGEKIPISNDNLKIIIYIPLFTFKI